MKIPGLNEVDPNAEDLFPESEEDEGKVIKWAVTAFEDADKARADLKIKWDRYYQMYRSFVEDRPAGDWRSRVWMPVSFYVIETITPRLVAQLPKFTVMPVGPEDTEGSKVMEQLLDWATDKSDLYLELVKAFKSALTYGTGIVKTYYDEKTAWNIYRKPVMKPVFMEMPLGEIDIDGNPMSEQVQVGEEPDPTQEPQLVREPITTYAGPVAEAVDIGDFFPSPEATEIEDAGYVVHRVFRTKDHIESMAKKGAYHLPDSDKWENFTTAYDFTSATRQASINLGPGTYNTTLAGQKLIEMWEIWTDDYIITIAGQTVLLRAERNPFAHGEKPFVRIVDHLVPHEFWGIGELEPLEGIQDTMNALWNSRIDNVKLVLNSMFVVSTDYLQDPRDLTIRPGGVVRVREGVPIDQVVKNIDLGEVTSSSYTEAAEMERMSEKVSGVSAYQMGTDSPSLNRTATGVALISEQGNTRFAHKVRISELTGLRRLARHYGTILQQYMPEQMVIRILGQQGQLFWQTVTADSISGAFDYQVEAESAQQTESIRREQSMGLFQTLIGLPEINRYRLIEDVLDTFQRKDKQAYVLSPEMMQMQQMQEMAMQAQATGMDAQATAQAEPPEQAPPEQGPPPQQGPPPA